MDKETFIENYRGFSIYKIADNQFIAKDKNETLYAKTEHGIYDQVYLYTL